MSEVEKVKKFLKSEFEMKDLGSAKRILGMEITRNRSDGLLFLSQAEYLKKVLERFGYEDLKPVSTPLANHFKLTAKGDDADEEEQEFMQRIPYANMVGSLMYAMVCTRPDLTLYQCCKQVYIISQERTLACSKVDSQVHKGINRQGTCIWKHSTK